MKKIATFAEGALLTVFASITCAEPVAPELILKPGENRTIQSRRWVFSKIDIPAGAVLQVDPGSDEPLQLIVQNDFSLNGSIIARGWSSDEASYQLIPPNSTTIQVKFTNSNKGGNGGDGAPAAGALGGRGAKGTAEYGGGGGGGGARGGGHGGPGNVKGADAIDERGAPKVIAYCGVGGSNGASRSEAANGGVIYLEVHGTFDGTNGLIDVRGQDGLPGAAGQGWSTSTTTCSGGSGGAGGGGPGGQGGVVVGYLAGPVLAYPAFKTQGGAGGAAGKAAPNAISAAAGQAGKTGWVQWMVATQLTKEQ